MFHFVNSLHHSFSFSTKENISMALNTAFRLAYFASLLICMVKSNYGNQVFDVAQYGAVADGKTDNSDAFLNAWNAACELGGSATLLIPRGTFFLGPVSFRGPCTNKQSPRVEIQGKILAPSSLDRIKTIGWIEFRSLSRLTIGGPGVLDGQGSESWSQTTCPGDNFCKSLPISLRLIKLTNSSIENLTLLNSKGFHMAIHRSNFVKVRNLKISAPGDSPNTDGCHISGSTFVDIANTTIGTGDDCISLGPGSSNVSISGVVCNPGHGISVGSLGKRPNEQDVVGVIVRNCTISNAANGVRVKTWPGSQRSAVKDLIFEDIIMNNVSKPIMIDQGYCPSRQCTNKPSLVQISNVLFKNIRGTSSQPRGVNIFCSKSMPCKNLHLEMINLKYIKDGIRPGASSYCSRIFENVFWHMKYNPC